MSINIGLMDLACGDGGKGNAYSVILAEAQRRFPKSNDGQPVLSYSPLGGNNAANTHHIDGEDYKLRQTSGGVLINNAFSQLGEEKYILPRQLKGEIQTLRERGVEITPHNLGIAPNAHVTLEFHVNDDYSNLHTEGEHASTGNGILQTARDKYGRTGIRFVEFLDANLMAQILVKSNFDKSVGPIKEGRAKDLANSYAAEREFLVPFIKQDHVALRDHGSHLKVAINAHGIGLDINAGMYPGITSSHPGKLPRWVDVGHGVLKLYASSVGFRDRAFVSRFSDLKMESGLREEWGERGTGTLKDRGLGHLDLMLAKYGVEYSGVKYLIATCGDRMEAFYKLGIKPEITVGYKIDGYTHYEWHESFHRRDTLRRAEPVNIKFEPWEKFVEEDCQTLTPNARKYQERIESELGLKFSMLTKGGCGEKDAIMPYGHILDLS
jgi:adenylosuccinate synthase